MADDNKKKDVGVSFSFLKKKAPHKAYIADRNALDSDATTEKNEERDFIHGAEGKELKSKRFVV